MDTAVSKVSAVQMNTALCAICGGRLYKNKISAINLYMIGEGALT
jgi:hypothetical protein